MKRSHALARRRLVVSGGLAGTVLALFGLAAFAEQLTGHSSLLWPAATAVVAVVVPLILPWLNTVADRVAYGPDGDPYAYISTFAERIGATLAVDDVLPHLARTASQAVHSPRGEVRLWLADGGEWRQTWPPETADDSVARTRQVQVPLRHGGDTVGRLGVTTAEQLSPADHSLLELLAAPAGLALSNVRLTLELRRRLAQAVDLAADLERSQQRLLEAAAGQRRRFALAVDERVLRPLADADELLAGITDREPEALVAVRAETVVALEALRDLAAGVFPAALYDRGLVQALELALQRDWTDASLEADGLRDVALPDEVAAAGYFCVTAMLADMPPGRATTVTATVEAGWLQLQLTGAASPGSETLLFADDRAAALGGKVIAGTVAAEQDGRHVVTVLLPLQEMAAT